MATPAQPRATTLISVIERLDRLDAYGEPLHGELTRSSDDLAFAREALVNLACEIDLIDRYIAAALYDLRVKRGRRKAGAVEAVSELCELSGDLQTLTEDLKRVAGMHGTYACHGQWVEGWKGESSAIN